MALHALLNLGNYGTGLNQVNVSRNEIYEQNGKIHMARLQNL